MSKYKLNWQHPKSLNYIACGFIVLALGCFLQFPVAITWWVSFIYFVLLSAFIVVAVIALRATSAPVNFSCTDCGKLEFIDNLGEVNRFELLPVCSLQSDYFCILALCKIPNPSRDTIIQTGHATVASSDCLRSLVTSSAVFYSPEAFVKTTSEISFLLLPKDSLSDVCFRRLCRILRQNRFLHLKRSA